MEQCERDMAILTLVLAWVYVINGFTIDSGISGSESQLCITAGVTVYLTCRTPPGYVFQYWVHPHPNMTEIKESVEGKFTLDNTENINRYELAVKNVTEEDGGTYMCVFNDSEVLVAQSIKVIYQEQVNFLTNNSQVHYVPAGSNHRIQCLAKNYESIIWKNHEFNAITTLPSERVHATRIDGGVLLIFMGAVFQDNGTYYCFASNKVTPQRHIQVFIHVYAQPMVTVTPSIATVKELGNVSFICNASGFPQLSVVWYRALQHSFLPTSSISTVQESEYIVSTLHLYSVAITDADDYYCSAFNPYGRDNSSATLAITCAPNCCILPTNVEAHLIEQHSIDITWLPPVCKNLSTKNYMLTIRWWILSNNTWSGSHVIQDPFNTTHYTITDVDTQATYSITVSAGGNTSDVINITTGITEITMENSTASDISAVPVAVGTVAGACFLILVILIFIPCTHLTYLQNKKKCREVAAECDAAYASQNAIADDGMDNADRPMDSVAQRPRIPAPDSSYTITDFSGLVSDIILIPSTCICILDFIGQGEFGIVFKAHLNHPRSSMLQTAAIKTLKGFLSREKVSELLMESVKMKDFDHPNVLSLIGICVDGGPAPYIVMPFMANGSLLSYLRKERESLVVSDTANESTVVLSQKKLLDILLQIAKGMEYLASKGVLHRDLAARNCMIDSGFIIKVADFGMSESVYSKDYFRHEMQSEAKLPVKWMAPESLSDGIFTEKTDVWSFGVTFWEVFTGGKILYPAISPRALPQLLEQGQRLIRPLNAACTDDMHSVMDSCWDADPQQRPSFSQLVSTIVTHLSTLSDYLQL